MKLPRDVSGAQQVAYAATDAWACRELYLRFQELGLLQGGDGP